MMKTISIFLGLLTLTSCAATKQYDFKLTDTSDQIGSLRCAAQQAGWLINRETSNSVSGSKVVGSSNITITMSAVIDKNNIVHLNIHHPRGGNFKYRNEYLETLRSCGNDAAILVASQDAK